MISTSSNWKTYSRDIGTFHIKAVLTKGATTLNLTDSDFMESSVGIADSISGMTSIELGAVVTNSFSATLNNFDGKFNNFNFAGATITVQFGIIYEDSTEEWINRGTYLVDKPMTYGNTISIECYDYMDKLNKFINGITGLTFPMTGKALIQAICTYCGVTFGAWDNSLNPGTIDVLTADMFDASTTCRQVVSWVLQTVGGYARINPVTNRLDCKQFGNGVWLGTVAYNGGTMSSWTAGTTYDGGTMSPWNDTDKYGGGLMSDAPFKLSKIKNQSIYVDDFYITGIKVIPYNFTDENDYATAGSNGYVITIENNPLISTSNANSIASAIWNGVSGLTVRPFSANIFGDPSYEAGDLISITDTNGETVKSIVTNLSYSLSGSMALSCDADSPQEITADYADKYWYTNNKLALVEADLQTQIDGKVETWATAYNPARWWLGSTIRNKHIGDLWYYTGTEDLLINERTSAEMTVNPSKTYRYLGQTNLWEEYDNPDETLFDLADGKTTIYYGTPSQYKDVAEDDDYLVDSTDGSTYKFDSNTTVKWVKQTDYAGELEELRDDLEEQIDGKIQTWVSGTTSAPSSSWTTNTERAKHVGDLWYYNGTSEFTLSTSGITVEPSKTYQYYLDGSTYKWRAYNEPAESLFDYADGKSTVYYGSTSDTHTGVEDGDYLVDSVTNITYKYNKPEGSSTGTWEALIASPAPINLLPKTYYREYVSGTSPYTTNNITFTLNKDGSVTASGTASAAAYYVLASNTLTSVVPLVILDPSKRYRLHGCPSGGSTSKYRIICRATPAGATPGGSSDTNVYDVGSGVTLPANTKYAYVYIGISSGQTVDLTFYPMLEVGNVNHPYVSSHENTAGLIETKVDALDDSLNQLEVFNRLTGGGANEGLYLENGHCYVNATYIKTGTLNADRIGAGTITGAITATDLTMTGGAISMTSSTGDNWISMSETVNNVQYNVSVNPPMTTWTKKWGTGSNSHLHDCSILSTLYNDRIQLSLFGDNTSQEASISSLGNAWFTGTCSAGAFANISSIEKKKSIDNYKDSALDKIKSADILTYNYQNEEKGAKKHIGLAIGGDYNVPEELIVDSVEGDAQGIDLYSMISMAWKAIQEQQEKIESLEKRVAELESKKESR